MSIKKEEQYPIETEIHDRQISLRKWKGKDVKVFSDILENSFEIEALSDEQLQKLVIPCIKDYNDEYYSTYDLLNLLVLIRSATLGDKIDFTYLCTDCDSDMNIDVVLSTSSDFEPDTHSTIELEGVKYNLVKELKQSIIDKKSKELPEEDDTLIELVLRIHSFEDENGPQEGYTFDEMLEYIRDLDMKTFEKLIDIFVDQMSYFSIIGTYICPNEECKAEHNLEFDVLPDFFGKI